MTQKSGKGDALRKEKALLHTFVAGQKYGVWQYVMNCRLKDFVFSHFAPAFASLWPLAVRELPT